MKQTTFLTLTRKGAVLVRGYYIKGYGYYKSGAYWRGIHHATGVMAAQDTTLKAAQTAVQARQHIVDKFMSSDVGIRAVETFAKACVEYFVNGGTLNGPLAEYDIP